MPKRELDIIRYIIIGLFLTSSLLARDNGGQQVMAKPSTLEFIQFTGNNISNWMGNNGHLTSHIPYGDAGCEWPAGSGKTAVFTSGIWVMGKVNGELRSAVTEYATEWSPGTIPYDPVTRQPTSNAPLNTPAHQIYSIQKGDSSDPSSPNYNREYATWPASEGAPAHDGEIFTDTNGNGVRDAGEPYQDFDGDGNYDPPDGLYVTGEDPPKLKGDEMAWHVMNDIGAPIFGELWGTDPLGVEAQVLTYNRSDQSIYENIQFYDIKLVNKGGNNIDSTYFSLWSDVDLGDATDDAGGCDSSLSLAYIFNGREYDREYGLTAPAVGYTILQGPLVNSPGDSVVYEDETYPDQTTLDMSAFILILKYNPFNDPENAEEGYNLVRGLTPNDGDPLIDPWGNITTFHVSGDPVSGSGWTSIASYWLGDKRLLMSSGPFTMEPWSDDNLNGIADFGEPGVQVIHAALIIVSGIDYLDSITSLKYATQKVHSDYAQGFVSPSLDKPIVSATPSDQEIVLNWSEGSAAYEEMTSFGYAFEGYNVYQGETSEGPWTRLETYDVINGVGLIEEVVADEYGFITTELVQFGDDTGLRHLLSITEDALNEGAPLVNNKLYHFALSAYAYNEASIPKTLESPFMKFSIRPQITYETAGVRDTLTVVHTGHADAKVTVDVLDPGQLKGLNYKLGFDYDSTLSKGRWHLTRRATSFEDTALLGAWAGYGPWESIAPEKIYVDGFELSLREISFTKPILNHSWVQSVNLIPDTNWVDSYLAVSPGGVDSLMIVAGDTVSLMDYFQAEYWWNLPDYSIRETGEQTWFDIPQEAPHSVRIQGFAQNFGASGGDRLADIPSVGGGSEDVDFLQADLEVRFTDSGQKATRYLRGRNDTLITVPFELWDIERNIQLCIGIKDNNKTGNIQDTSLADWENTLDLDWVIVFDRDYQIYADSLQSFWDNPYSGWAWQFWYESRFSVGDVVSLHFVNPIDPEVDVFTWSTGGLGSAYDKDALESIQVFPNPYFGFHQDQTSFSNPYVTFSNLPNQETTIRIYSLGGHLVKRIDHEIGAYENWDLRNERGHFVASGIYIVHVEVPDLGNKILKLAILEPEW